MESFFSTAFGDPSGASFDAHRPASWLYFVTLFSSCLEGMFETLSKMGTERKHHYLLCLSHIRDLGKLTFWNAFGIIFRDYLEPHFGKASETHLCDLGSLLGSKFAARGGV